MKGDQKHGSAKHEQIEQKAQVTQAKGDISQKSKVEYGKLNPEFLFVQTRLRIPWRHPGS